MVLEFSFFMKCGIDLSSAICQIYNVGVEVSLVSGQLVQGRWDKIKRHYGRASTSSNQPNSPLRNPKDNREVFYVGF